MVLQIHNVNLQIKSRGSETAYFKALQYHGSGIQMLVDMTFSTHRKLRHSDITFDGLLFSGQSTYFVCLLLNFVHILLSAFPFWPSTTWYGFWCYCVVVGTIADYRHFTWVVSQNCEKCLLDSSCPSVSLSACPFCVSVSMEQLGSNWNNFHEIWYLIIF